MTRGETLSVERAGEKGGGDWREARRAERVPPPPDVAAARAFVALRAADGDCISECVMIFAGEGDGEGEGGEGKGRRRSIL